MNILLVKLSSLGDVLHNLPIVWDIRKFYPNARIDWVVEETYVELLKPLQSTETFKGIDHIIPTSLRRWHKELKKGNFFSTLHEFNEMRYGIKRCSYDVVIDTQGLLKSALVCRLIKRKANTMIVGLGNQVQYSGYEPIARWFYTNTIKVDTKSHAVDCCRFIAASALDIPIPNRDEDPPQFYPKHFIDTLKNCVNPLALKKQSYVLFFHATAKAAKCWDLNAWSTVGDTLAEQGFTIVYPWGNLIEKKISETLASRSPAALVPRAFTVAEAFILIMQAKLILGVDTGLTHLSAVLGKPTIELYIDSPKWKTEGYWHSTILNLGDKGKAPKAQEVSALLNGLIT